MYGRPAFILIHRNQGFGSGSVWPDPDPGRLKIPDPDPGSLKNTDPDPDPGRLKIPDPDPGSLKNTDPDPT